MRSGLAAAHRLPTAAREHGTTSQFDRRTGTPEEVAGITFLASGAARFVNGAACVMDGGMTAV